jgi:hypothetical protein
LPPGKRCRPFQGYDYVVYYLPVVPDQASLVLLDSGLLNPSGLE